MTYDDVKNFLAPIVATVTGKGHDASAAAALAAPVLHAVAPLVAASNPGLARVLADPTLVADLLVLVADNAAIAERDVAMAGRFGRVFGAVS